MEGQLKRGAILSYVVIFVKLIVNLTYTPYMLRALGTSEYGLYSIGASIVAYLTVLDLGFGNAIVRYTAKYRAEGKAKEQEVLIGMFIILYSVIGFVTLCIGALMIIGADSFFEATMTQNELYKVKIILALMVFNVSVTFPLSVWGSIMTAYEQFVFPKIVSIARVLLNAIIMVVLLYLGYKAIALVVVASFFNILSLLLNYLYCVFHLKIKVRYETVSFIFLKEIIGYSFLIFLNVIMDKVYWNSGQIILGAFSGTRQVAEFSISVQIILYFMLLNVAVSNMVLPRITFLVVKGTERMVSDFVIKVSRLQFFLISYILGGFILFGKRFVLLWAGDQYEISFYCTLILMIPMSIDILFSTHAKVLQARNQMLYRSIVCVVSAFICLILQIPAAKFFGSLGVSSVIAFVFAIQIAIMAFHYHIIQKINMIELSKSIIQISWVPIILVLLFFIANTSSFNNNFVYYLSLIIIYTTLSLLLFWFFVMNEYEKALMRSIVVILRS